MEMFFAFYLFECSMLSRRIIPAHIDYKKETSDFFYLTSTAETLGKGMYNVNLNNFNPF